MSKNCSDFTYKCNFCFYQSNKRYNLIRHQNAKHMDKINENNRNLEMCANVSPPGANVSPPGANVSLNIKNINFKY